MDGSSEQRARIAVEVAMRQIGLPYVWGGNGPENGHRGFDCSGLTTFAYAKAGVTLPRTAHTQFRHGPRLPAGVELRPGDLVFYGTYAKVHHVGMFIGQGRMVNAPTFGQPVQTAWYRWSGDDYLGATRPTAEPGTTAPPLREVPETPDPSIPDITVFPAPPAPALPLPPPITHLPAVTPSPTSGPPAAPSGPSIGPTAVAAPPQAPGPISAPQASPSPIPPTTSNTAPPTLSGGPSGTSKIGATPTPSAIAPAPALPPAVAILDAGTLRPLDTVELAPNRIPTGPGSTSDRGQWQIRLTAPLAASAPETPIVVRTAQGEHHLTIVATGERDATEIAALTEPLVVLVPLGTDRWQVTTATPRDWVPSPR
ncbi:NlpC/P60 family protein [Pseudonocardia sp. ICBG601]|uniref:NlpC/P60 family protein n=1 Tax=Pseudonocardia sp. ICBG601 TaxID=2846759 RepID=UPI0035AC0488